MHVKSDLYNVHSLKCLAVNFDIIEKLIKMIEYTLKAARFYYFV